MALNHNEKKNKQLGINQSTASGRLVKDILFNFIQQTGNDTCFHCGGKLSREDFSIEHKIPWLDSENPIKLFFDLDNISFSHLKCNISKARRPSKLSPNEREAKRIADNEIRRIRAKTEYTTEKRRNKKLTTGH